MDSEMNRNTSEPEEQIPDASTEILADEVSDQTAEDATPVEDAAPAEKVKKPLWSRFTPKQQDFLRGDSGVDVFQLAH